MESQPQNPEFRNNLENFHPCVYKLESMQSVFSMDVHSDNKINTLISNSTKLL